MVCCSEWADICHDYGKQIVLQDVSRKETVAYSMRGGR